MRYATYMVVDGDGTALTDGLQASVAYVVAQRVANNQAESVWLCPSGGEGSDGSESFGLDGTDEPCDTAEGDEIKPETLRCQCGEATGERCPWVGYSHETEMVEWMPPHLRESHLAAGNSGSYPSNGALRLRCAKVCAEALKWEED